MARTNRTEYALLGLLALEPRSGYDIKSEVENVLSHFWHESYGHIYPVLKRLHDHGLLDRRKEVQEGRPDRFVYSITEDGRVELQRWLAEPVERTPPRNELLLKVFFGALGDAGALADVVARYRDDHARSLEVLSEVSRVLADDEAEEDHDPRTTACWLLTVDLGLRAGRAFQAWAEDAEARLRELAEGDAAAGAGR